MLFNKQFKELILRRPKEPDAPASGEDATRIRNGAPGPNDEVTLCVVFVVGCCSYC